MALSYCTEAENEAPRDFRVSSTESDGHYTKCLLCYTIKKNFYCVECIRAGNFAHSTMPYADRYAEKQGKLLRLRANRNHIQGRCEDLLHLKRKKDSLRIDAKQSRDKIELLKLAIEQRKSKIEDKRQQLSALSLYNNELRGKLPKYQKRVSVLGKHAFLQKAELHDKVSSHNDKAQRLAALRRSRIRQLIKYIFPVYITYDNCSWSPSSSAEGLEFVQVERSSRPSQRARLHVVAPWLPADGHYAPYAHYRSEHKEGAGAGGAGPEGGESPSQRLSAALSLAAQLAALLAWWLDVRLPHPLNFSEYGSLREMSSASGGVEGRARRLCACAVALALRSGRAPPAAPRHALLALHELACAAAVDDPLLGRAEAWLSAELASAGAAWETEWAATDTSDDDEPPEHLHWADDDTAEQISGSPPTAAPAPSLVTSAAASLASFWRVWAK